MGRHRRPPDNVDERGRLFDNDVVVPDGYTRWTDLLLTRQNPMVVANPEMPAELVRPYVTRQDGARWPR